MMELYIGGFSQGKTAYVKEKYPKELWLDERDYKKYVHAYLEPNPHQDINQDKKIYVWNHFHLAVKELLTDGYATDQIINAILCWNENVQVGKLVIICDEIGNGIVPMDKNERVYREETGRILIQLAKQADRVERIICGISQIIKSK